MNLLEKIPYKSVFMRCDHIDESTFTELSEGFSIVNYQDGMGKAWAEIQKAAGQFEGYSDAGIEAYFDKTFLGEKGEAEKRCFFLKDVEKEQYIGTCSAWFSKRGEETVPILHWLAVVPAYRNQGCARMLITQVMRYFEKNGGNQAVYLHTQPESYKAIKLYHDFGFNITKKDSVGHSKNEYEEAVGILKEVMRAEAFERLMDSAVE